MLTSPRVQRIALLRPKYPGCPETYCAEIAATSPCSSPLRSRSVRSVLERGSRRLPTWLPRFSFVAFFLFFSPVYAFLVFFSQFRLPVVLCFRTLRFVCLLVFSFCSCRPRAPLFLFLALSLSLFFFFFAFFSAANVHRRLSFI